MPRKRRDLLKELIERSRPIPEIIEELSKFEFDSAPLLLVGKNDVLNILSSYLEGGLSKADVEEWADAIEVRDDLDYRPDHGDTVKEIIHDLANPLLSGPLTLAEARRLKSALQAA